MLENISYDFKIGGLKLKLVLENKNAIKSLPLK